MWIKQINAVNIQNLGLDDEQHEGSYAIVKRVTLEVDVVMLPRHDEHSDPFKKIHESMDKQIPLLKEPIMKSVYKETLVDDLQDA